MYQISSESNKIYVLLGLSKDLQCTFDKRDENLNLISKIMIFYAAPVYQISFGLEKNFFFDLLIFGR